MIRKLHCTFFKDFGVKKLSIFTEIVCKITTVFTGLICRRVTMDKPAWLEYKHSLGYDFPNLPYYQVSSCP